MTARELDRSDFHWPNGLYESSPFIYVATGLWISLQLEGPVAKIASAFLILAGLGILYLRWSYRKLGANTESIESVSAALVAEKLNEIDTHDRELFISRHGLVAAANQGSPALVDALVHQVLGKLEAQYHLQDKLLPQSNPEAVAERRCEHQALSAKIGALHQGYIEGKVTRKTLIECIVYEAIVEHTRGQVPAENRAFWN